jgi:hypothetical protein
MLPPAIGLPLALAALLLPGHAIVAAVWPRGRLTGLERNALAFAAGLLVLPIAGLIASETMGFRILSVSLVLLIVTLAAGLVAWRRHRAGRREWAARSAVPSTKWTLAIVGGALLVSGGLTLAGPLAAPYVAPASLALTASDGSAALPRTLERGANVSVVLEARAGDASSSAPLIVSWDDQPLFEAALDLGPQEARRIDVRLPTDDVGPHRFVATWGEREVHMLVQVGRSLAEPP